MKATVCTLFTVTLLGAGVDVGRGQESKTRVIDGGGGASVVVKPAKQAPVVYETTIKLAPARQWTSTDGKRLIGELLAWPIKGVKVAEADLRGVKIEVVREKKVRLRTGGKVAVVALERFSEADREFVEELVDYHEKWRKKPGKKASSRHGQGETVRKN